MTITLTSKEVALLIADRATRMEANAETWRNDAKKYANRVRELLDLYDEAFAREEAEFETVIYGCMKLGSWIASFI